jgi:NAD(P)H-dependent FMN reductase
MKRLLLNGSPRGRDGNSRRLLGWIGQGLEHAGLPMPQSVDLAPHPTRAEAIAAFLDADEIVVAFPLYTDAMPAVVKAFFEALAAQEAPRLRGKRVAFVIQSGFPEAIHTEVLAEYLARLAQRLGWEHLGTLRKGGVESIRMMPPKQVEKFAKDFRAAGRALGETGAFPTALLGRMAGTRTFGVVGRLVVRLLVLTGLGNIYWNGQLKRHRAFGRRFDAPYAAPFTG